MSAATLTDPPAMPRRLRIADYERRLRVERARAEAAFPGRTEALVTAVIRAADEWGWRLLDTQPCGPGDQLIAVGPGGVLVIDVACWPDADVVDGCLYNGAGEASDDLNRLLARAAAVCDAAAELGVAPSDVVPVLVLAGQHGTDLALGRVQLLDDRSLVPWAVARGVRLDDLRIAALTELFDRRLPGAGAVPVTSGGHTAVEPIMPFGRHAATEPNELFDVDAMGEAVLRHATARPRQPWMTSLHPDQLRLVRREGSGAARIRGAAGTGKTVVALHRAAYLAESSSGPILFTTFVTTLPPVLRTLYAQLSPGTTGRVEFASLHKWASGFLRQRGHHIRVDTQRADAAFDLAWAEHGKDSGLGDIGVTARYAREEIDSVIKGRGLVAFAEYASLRRVGRRVRLGTPQREVVWQVYRGYERRLEEAGIVDFNDLLLLARAELRERPLTVPYAAVIADEVQDLTCLAVQLLADLAGDSGRLLLIGDGQQQVYPGGFTLAEAGVSVAGRSNVLTVNYRNPTEIAHCALAVVGDDGWNDLEAAEEYSRREVTLAREGGSVRQERAASVEELRDAVVRQVWSLLEAGRPASGIAVLCTTSAEVRVYAGLLRRGGLPVITLDRYVGLPVQAIKVGTVRRAKGLEFDDVIHPVHEHVARRDQPADAGAEERTLLNRTRYVAMTRARDTVWLGSIA